MEVAEQDGPRVPQHPGASRVVGAPEVEAFQEGAGGKQMPGVVAPFGEPSDLREHACGVGVRVVAPHVGGVRDVPEPFRERRHDPGRQREKALGSAEMATHGARSVTFEVPCVLAFEAQGVLFQRMPDDGQRTLPAQGTHMWPLGKARVEPELLPARPAQEIDLSVHGKCVEYFAVGELRRQPVRIGRRHEGHAASRLLEIYANLLRCVPARQEPMLLTERPRRVTVGRRRGV
ncbi:hypothetical protein ACFQHO_27570 [Actinomadura yumaensis]|uniref:hypothetical protein n=1 Tax=Actinomadura yumaensis TaxID=111807 RepID=UPI0036123C2C